MAQNSHHQEHLDHEFELSHSAVKFLYDHYFDTIDALGGLKGMFLILIGCVVFYGYVLYSIRSGRARREAKAKGNKVH
jgi:hypothetical protein